MRQARPEDVPARVAGLQEELKAAAKQLAELKGQLAIAKSQVGREDACSRARHGEPRTCSRRSSGGRRRAVWPARVAVQPGPSS
jgi:alanyl-tRNA synthetase